MQKYTLLLLATFFSLHLFGQQARYFDVNHAEISKTAFEEKRATNTVLDIPGDSSHHHQLVNREEQGKIDDKTQLTTLLESALGKKIDATKPIVIIYYPGQDACNSAANPDFVTEGNKLLAADLFKQAKVKPIFVYKEPTGLAKSGKNINWIKDPQQTIEKHFFKHHYPCGSFVVISKNGEYSSYFGEYMRSDVVEVKKKLNQ